MSVFVMAWVWKHGPANPTDRLVLLSIADHADDEGIAFPSMAGIAAKSCMTERGARGVVRRLEDGGWITTEVGGGRGGKSVYTVLMLENPEQQTRNAGSGYEVKNPERDCTKPGTLVPPNHHITIKEPSERVTNASKPSSKKKRARLPDGWRLPKDCGEWAMSKGMTEATVRHEAEQFENHHRSRGSLMLDWKAAWRTWVGNWVKFGSKQAGQNVARFPSTGPRKPHWQVMQEREELERRMREVTG